MTGKVPETFSAIAWGRRFFRTSALTLSQPQDKKVESEVAKTQPPNARGQSQSFGGLGLKGAPTALDKRFLVWSGMFKAMNEIPAQLDEHTIHRARSWGRIRLNIVFLFIAAAGGGLMVYLGKSAAARGESVEKQNLDWHRKIREDYEKSQSK